MKKSKFKNIILLIFIRLISNSINTINILCQEPFYKETPKVIIAHANISQ